MAATNWRQYWCYHFNLDGFVVHTNRSDPNTNSYVQLFRDGTIEAVNAGVIDIYEPAGYGMGFAGLPVERVLIQAVQNFRLAWRMLEVSPPLAVGIVITGVRGLKISPASQRFSLPPATIDRDVVIAPEVVLDDLSAPQDILLRPVFDLVWNTGGWPGSPHYRDGRWTDSW